MGILVVLGTAAVGLSWFSGRLILDGALESQTQTLSRIIGVAGEETLRQVHKQAGDLGSSTQQNSTLRAGFKAGDRGAMRDVLDEQWHQRYVTLGILKLIRLRVYDLDLNLVAESREGASGLPRELPHFLYAQASDRSGADRLKLIGGLWLSPLGPAYSVLVPLGGLRPIGYVEVVADPVHNLRAVEEMIEAPLAIAHPDGKVRYRSEGWAERSGGDSLPVAHVFDGADGRPAVRLGAQEDVSELFARNRRTQLTSVAAFAAIIALGVAFALWTLDRQLFQPMRRLMAGMRECAEGNLAVKVDARGLRETSEISRGLRSLVDSLRGEVTTIRSHADQVAQSAGELSTVTGETSDGAARQQAETEQVATAMDELSRTAQEVARHAENAAEGAHSADVQTRRGKQVVTDTMQGIRALAEEVERAAEAMQRLETDTENIGSVSDVIRGIAEQTNLLALNAAIEAARAGDQGRGFAVVADEVRTLAQRTQESTQQIQESIERLQSGARDAAAVMMQGRDHAQSTVEQAAEAGTTLEAITEAVASITGMNTQIATAAEEQTQVVEEINDSVAAIADVAQHNVAGTRQTAEAGETLAKLAVQLQDTVGRFRL